VDAQDADKEKQIQAQEIQAQEIQAQEGEHDQNMEESSLAVNIAQLIPTHLRPEFAATVASSIRANQEQGSSKMTHIQVQKVTKDIQDLLRKPPRVIHPTPMVAEQENNRNEEEEAKQNRINKILNKAITYIRNGQQSEAIRELAKEDLQQVAIPKSATTQEITEMVAKLFPAAAFEDAPRVMVVPDDSFKTWLRKAVQKIKASGIDGISTQVFRALQMEDEAVTFIARMIERIVNAEVEDEELKSMSTLLLVLIPKADGGMRPVAIANTIVRMAKAYALHLGGARRIR
jgi:hypothetical protein